jgi:GMP synthase (glutamine-hydrolysing)
MPAPRLLVVEGNTVETRDQLRFLGGTVTGEGYADLLGRLLPGAVVDICFPTDPGANLPTGSGLEGYDGIAITGSALNIYDGGPAVAPQIELTRAALASGTPIFGSCWGLQLLTVAAGGSVRKNPKGREIGFARRIAVTAAGRGHAMFRAKAAVFDALCVHLDEIGALAPGTTVLARNDMSDVQAAEIRVNGTVAWGVQYHPEYTFQDMAVIVRRYGSRLIDEGLFTTPEEIEAFVVDLETLQRDRGNRPLAWRHGIDAAVLDDRMRAAEIANWITHQVLPTRSRRGRG